MRHFAIKTPVATPFSNPAFLIPAHLTTKSLPVNQYFQAFFLFKKAL
jgi:hypothetical protein